MKKQKIKIQQIIILAISLTIGVAIGCFMIWYIGEFFSDENSSLQQMGAILVFLLSMYAGLFFHTIVHEAGHLIFGLLSGYKFSSFRVFSFMFLLENGKIRIRKLSLAGTAGQCLMIPPDGDEGKIPFVLYNLGGSFMNFIVSSVTLVLFFVFNNAYVSIVMLVFSIFGFFLGITNILPLRIGKIDNDGYNAYSMCKNPDSVKAFFFQMKVNELVSKGYRLKDMPDEWFALPSDEEMQNNMFAAKGVFVCNRITDMHNFAEAKSLILHLLNTDNAIIDLYRRLLICDLIFIKLITFSPREEILSLLTKEQKRFMKAMKAFPSVIRTEYVISLIFENNIPKADGIKNLFEKTAIKYPYPSDIQSERELIEIADSIIKN